MAIDYKTATIFDLSSDPALIAEVLGYETTRAEYVATVPPENFALDMLALAEHIKDAGLQRDIRETCATELSSFFNE